MDYDIPRTVAKLTEFLSEYIEVEQPGLDEILNKALSGDLGIDHKDQLYFMAPESFNKLVKGTHKCVLAAVCQKGGSCNFVNS